MDIALQRSRLLRLAQMNAPTFGCNYHDAQDAVQDTLLAQWQASLKGKEWHEGRLVLELKNRIRARRRKAKVRQHINVPMDEHKQQ